VRLNLSFRLVGAWYVGRLVNARIVDDRRDLGGLVVLVNHRIPERTRPPIKLRQRGPNLPHPLPSLLSLVPSLLSPRRLVLSLFSARRVVASLPSTRRLVGDLL
jgi:hypothetical protein